jgi:hypothetical protein
MEKIIFLNFPTIFHNLCSDYYTQIMEKIIFPTIFPNLCSD